MVGRLLCMCIRLMTQFLLFSFQKFQQGDRTCVPLVWDPIAAASQQDSSQPAGGAATDPTKLSGQRTYLQSLDRNSRAWLLSSGKSQASEDVLGPLEDNGGNIWYNPIPEEEDAGGPCRDEDVWRRRGGPPEGAGDTRDESGGEGRSSDWPQEGANPSVSHMADDIRAEHPGRGKTRLRGSSSSPLVPAGRCPYQPSISCFTTKSRLTSKSSPLSFLQQKFGLLQRNMVYVKK